MMPFWSGTVEGISVAGDSEHGDRFDREYYASVTRTDSVRRLGSHWWSNRFFAQRVRKALHRNGGRRCLELGCAHGHILELLEADFETHGIDLSEYAVGQSRRIASRSSIRVGDIARDLRRLFDPGHFDVIFAKSVFEHLETPGAVIADCRDLLTPRGVLLFAVPSTVNILRPLKGAAWIGTRDPSHVSVLTPEQWSELLRDNGFAVLHSYSTGFWDVPYLPLLPNALQQVLFGPPTAIALLTGSAVIPPWLGENLIVEAAPFPL